MADETPTCCETPTTDLKQPSPCCAEAGRYLVSNPCGASGAGSPDFPWCRCRYIKYLRLFLRDTEDQNVLLCNRVESRDDELGMYLDLAIDYFNNDIPFTAFSYCNFPSKHWLLFRAVIETQFSIGLLHVRNTMDYNDGGRSIRDFGKQNDHMNFVSALIQQTEQHKRAMKRNINAQNFYGYLASEYIFVNRFFKTMVQ
jgi:hypothetical protein